MDGIDESKEILYDSDSVNKICKSKSRKFDIPIFLTGIFLYSILIVVIFHQIMNTTTSEIVISIWSIIVKNIFLLTILSVGVYLLYIRIGDIVYISDKKISKPTKFPFFSIEYFSIDEIKNYKIKSNSKNGKKKKIILTTKFGKKYSYQIPECNNDIINFLEKWNVNKRK